MMQKEHDTDSALFRNEVTDTLIAFPLVNLICFLSETESNIQLLEDGIPIDERDQFRYGLPKILAGSLGFLYATGSLDKNSENNRYILTDRSIVSAETINQAFMMRSLLRQFYADWQTVAATDLETIPFNIQRSLALPLLRLISRTETVDIDLKNELSPLLTQLHLGNETELNYLGRYLAQHRVIGSFLALTNSYHRLVTNLYDGSHKHEALQFKGDYSRDEAENAIASNMLIMNTVERLRNYLDDTNREVVLDLGSGGGFFASHLHRPVILFDRSAIANEQAYETFNYTKENIKGIITGSIIDPADLLRAKKYKPDAVTINYILHDILGQTVDYQTGVQQLREFLYMYKEIFARTPLLITESWDVSWDDLRTGNKPHISLFHWLHAISPQRLMTPDFFLSLLQETGFSIQDKIVHGTLKLESGVTPINETWIVKSEN